ENKTFALFDFANMVPNHVSPGASGGSNHSAHGTSCAGVALGKADDEIGTAGAAPNCRLLGLIFPATDHRKIRMFIWAAGLPVQTNKPGFPKKLSEGADIFTCSIGFGEGFLLSDAFKDLLDHLTNRGRKGKGCLAIFSAGNEGQELGIRRPLGAYER